MSDLVKLSPKWHVENFNVQKEQWRDDTNTSGKWKCSNEDSLKEDGTISQSKRCDKI